MRRSIYEPLWIVAAVFVGAWLAAGLTARLRTWLLRRFVARYPALKDNSGDAELESALASVELTRIERYLLDLVVFGVAWVVLDQTQRRGVPRFAQVGLLFGLGPIWFFAYYALVRRRFVRQALMLAAGRGLVVCQDAATTFAAAQKRHVPNAAKRFKRAMTLRPGLRNPLVDSRVRAAAA